jgi:lambda family phage portal protein
MSFWRDILKMGKKAPTLQRRGFDVASSSELFADWSQVEESIMSDLRGNLQTIRSRARNLAKNNDHVVRFLGLVRTNVVGPNGFKLQMDIKELVPGTGSDFKWQADALANTLIEQAWNDWGRTVECSVNGRLTFRGLCVQIMEYVARDGEALVRMIRDKRAPFGSRLQVIDPEALDETYNERLTDGNLIIAGVEVDSFKRPIAYHLRKQIPESILYGTTSYSTERQRILASEILHVFDQKYESQTRGIPWMAQSMVRLRMLHGYEIAAVVNARAGANKHAVYTRSIDAQGDIPYTGKADDGGLLIDSAPGENVKLDPGWQLQSYDPAYPNGEHPYFVKSVLRSIASGLGVNYNLLGNDLEGVNYTSLRAGALDERETWMLIQNWFTEQFLNRVFAWWLENALLLGKIVYVNGSALPAEKYEKFNHPFFIGRRWDWVDPLKDMQSIQLMLQLGYTSLSRELGARGEDVEETFAEIKWVQELAAKYGVKLNFDTTSKQPAVPASVEEEVVAAAKKLLADSHNGNGHT